MAAALAAVVSFAACGSANASTNASGNGDQKTVRVATRGDNAKIWSAVAKELAKKGEKLEFKEYDSSANLNDMVLSGDADINAAQHYAALDYFHSKDKKYEELTDLGQLRISTIDLYSKKYKSVDDIPDGATIAVPNDPMNFGRSLDILAKNNVIKLGDFQSFPAEKDITDNPKHLKFKQISENMMIQILDDVDAGFIYAIDAVNGGLSPQKDALIQDKIDLKNNKVQHQFVVVLTIRKEDKDKQIYKDVLEAYHSPAVYKVIKDVFKGAVYPVQDDEPIDLSKY